jgi:phage shock protein PspC (stress-responsive transcriptional regulator)
MYKVPGSSNSLHRPLNDRFLAGVCGGLGRHFGIDSTIVRVVWVLFTLLGGSGFLAYLIAWLLMPDASGRRAATPLVLLLVCFVAIPAMCFLLTLPFRLLF